MFLLNKQTRVKESDLKPHSFSISLQNERTLVVSAASYEDKVAWIEAITKAVSRFWFSPMKARGFVELSKITMVRKSEAPLAPKWALDLVSPTNVYIVVPNSQEDQMRWAVAVHDVIAMARAQEEGFSDEEDEDRETDLTLSIAGDAEAPRSTQLEREAKLDAAMEELEKEEATHAADTSRPRTSSKPKPPTADADQTAARPQAKSLAAPATEPVTDGEGDAGGARAAAVSDPIPNEARKLSAERRGSGLPTDRQLVDDSPTAAAAARATAEATAAEVATDAKASTKSWEPKKSFIPGVFSKKPKKAEEKPTPPPAPVATAPAPAAATTPMLMADIDPNASVDDKIMALKQKEAASLRQLRDLRNELLALRNEAEKDRQAEAEAVHAEEDAKFATAMQKKMEAKVRVIAPCGATPPARPARPFPPARSSRTLIVLVPLTLTLVYVL